MSAGFWLADEIFVDPDIESPEELAVIVYIHAHRDMSGVCPINLRVVAGQARITARRVRQVLAGFNRKQKLIFSDDWGPNGGHIWWKSGIWYSLYKGNFSEKQKISVIKLLKKWEKSQIFSKFSRNFSVSALQHVENKYSLSIPIPSSIITESEYEYKAVTIDRVSDPPANQDEENLSSESPPDNPSTHPRKHPRENPHVFRLHETLQYGAGDWAFTVGLSPGSWRWVESLVEEFGLELCLNVVQAIHRYYADKGIPVPSDHAAARRKIREWCEREKNRRPRKTQEDFINEFLEREETEEAHE